MAGSVGIVFSNKPLSNVTPFTYRDGETYLEYLNRLRLWIDEVSKTLQENIDTVNDNNAGGINGVIAMLNAALAEINAKLLALTETDADLVFDPTKGVINAIGVSLGHVYDNTRYYAFFAEQLDWFNYTAQQWDEMQYSARHFDLALAYSPTEVQDENIIPPTVTPS